MTGFHGAIADHGDFESFAIPGTPVPPYGRPTGLAVLRSSIGAATVVVAAWLAASVANAEDRPVGERPDIQMQRWKEDWSPLADPALRTRPGDRWKYVPLAAGNPQSYVSFGAHLRERFEVDRNRLFAGDGSDDETALLQRLQIHADVHFDERWRAFVQIEDARAFGMEAVGPSDENPLDLRLAFIDTVQPLAAGSLTLRAGRQDLDVGSERFISNREGPNVRQSFDAVWADWAGESWRAAAFLARPTDHRPRSVFDDRFGDDIRFGSLRAEHALPDLGTLSAYYLLFENEAAGFLEVEGEERRHVFDLRWRGDLGNWDWDVEGMLQGGRVGETDAFAWAAGAEIGHAFPEIAYSPRIGLQADAASGDGAPGEGRLETFNPLFVSGGLFTLGDYTGYVNLLHLQPSLTVTPAEGLSIKAGLGLQWRQTTADAIYVHPSIPIDGTAGTGSRWSGAYGQLRFDYAIRDDLAAAVELVRYEAGDTIRDAGGADSSYVGFQLTADW